MTSHQAMQQAREALPACPQSVVDAITAYGDARADKEAGAKVDTATPLLNCIRAVRAALSQPSEEARDAARYRVWRNAGENHAIDEATFESMFELVSWGDWTPEAFDEVTDAALQAKDGAR